MARLITGVDIATIIEIEPIYFDLNKSNIRDDAAKELDKIVDVMNEYSTMVVELGSHTDCRASKITMLVCPIEEQNPQQFILKLEYLIQKEYMERDMENQN